MPDHLYERAWNLPVQITLPAHAVAMLDAACADLGWDRETYIIESYKHWDGRPKYSPE